MNNPVRELPFDEIPERLMEIPEPPKKLYTRGEMPKSDAKFLCIVGSRKYTDYGKEACQKLIAGLKGYNIVIVSGLALGIDGIAHRAALDAGLTTLAIPGSGLHSSVLYPSSNRQLAEKIVESGGALISEFEPMFRATTYSFPQRNRIMAGISHATLIIEAEIKSGTLITSRLATDYNRDVMAVPGSIFSKNSEGPNMLIRLGATPVSSSAHILETLGFKIEEDKTTKELGLKNLSDDERKVLILIKNPLSRDELIRELVKSGMSVSDSSALISIMEIKGLIEEKMGEIVRK
ncbi:MAG: DNA-processing protein DprA [Patescibacteria group bacterium]|nr:DNA-processing protein DprA [Patescibacteria group bacterium]MDE2218184.1 DNA-processing protein DprA [Patescibacteria group bacterium]